MSHQERCWLCGARARAERAREGSFSRVTCSACGAMYVSPLLSDAQARAVYENETRWSRDSRLDKGRDAPAVYEGSRRAVHVRIERELRALVGRPGRVLDVGCGSGAFLLFMRDAGWQVSGVDINPAVVDICHGLGLDVRVGSILEEREPGEGAHYDCVTFLNALGYMADPVAALQAASRLLRKGGVIAVEDPNSLFHRLTARFWAALRKPEQGLVVAPQPPRRLFVLGLRSYRSLFERAGLRAVQTIPSRARDEGPAPVVAVRRLIYAVADPVFNLTGRRLLISPSLLAFAHRPAPSQSLTNTLEG